MDYDRVVRTCPNSCMFHTVLIQNMLLLLAQKNLGLSLKIDYLSLKSLRGRIAAYLLHQSRTQTDSAVYIPFNRNGLAGYLCVDRSALSRELSRMKNEGLITYHKNNFQILNREMLLSLCP